MRFGLMVRITFRLLFAFALVAEVLPAEFRPAAWQMRRPLNVEKAAAVQRLMLPGDVLLGAEPGLSDLRLISGGREVPFRIRKVAGHEVLAGLESPEMQVNVAQHTSSVAIDLGRAVSFDRVDLAVRDPFFNRTAQVAISRDMQSWDPAGAGVISRSVQGENLSVSTPPVRTRFLRVTMYDRDDPPLQIKGVTLLGARRVLEFASAATTGRYWLYYGAPDARTPVYDLSALRALDGGPAHEVTASAEERNPDFAVARAAVDPNRSKRKQAVLRMALAVVGVVAGLLIVGLLLAYRMRNFRRQGRRRGRRQASTMVTEHTATESLLSLRRALGESVQPEAPIRVRAVDQAPRDTQIRSRPLLPDAPERE